MLKSTDLKSYERMFITQKGLFGKTEIYYSLKIVSTCLNIFKRRKGVFLSVAKVKWASSMLVKYLRCLDLTL